MVNLNIKNVQEWPLYLKIFLALIILFIIYFLGYMWDISTLQTTLEDAQYQEGEQKKQVEEVLFQQTVLIRELNALPIFKKTLNEWQRKLINYEEFPKAINDILKIGILNGVYFSHVEPEAENKTTYFIEMPINIEMMGTYHQIADFMSQVSNLPWIIVVQDFTINSPPAGTANATLLTSTLKLMLYRLNDTPPAPSAGTTR